MKNEKRQMLIVMMIAMLFVQGGCVRGSFLLPVMVSIWSVATALNMIEEYEQEESKEDAWYIVESNELSNKESEA